MRSVPSVVLSQLLFTRFPALIQVRVASVSDPIVVPSRDESDQVPASP
jgi:hypothetical protein